MGRREDLYIHDNPEEDLNLEVLWDRIEETISGLNNHCLINTKF